MGKITILEETTKNPITKIGERAGICWGADISDPEKNYKRGMDCITSEHGRTIEFPNVEMIIEGYSARAIREFYTHIAGSPTRLQESTRYVKFKDGVFPYVVPPSIEKYPLAKVLYQFIMQEIGKTYLKLIDNFGIPVEDAAMCLPMGMQTKIVDKRCMRSWIEMSHPRCCSRAYWEYRQMMTDVKKAMREYSEEWTWIANNLMVPKCEYLGYCTEKKSCGRKPKKEEVIK